MNKLLLILVVLIVTVGIAYFLFKNYTQGLAPANRFDEYSGYDRSGR